MLSTGGHFAHKRAINTPISIRTPTGSQGCQKMISSSSETSRNKNASVLAPARDIAPEVAAKHIEKEIPGLMDHIRVKHGMVNPNALLSRSVAGVTDKTLLFVLPGSTRAVKEYLDEILKSLWHMILMVNDIDSH